MKKIIALLLVIMMVITVSSCSKNKEEGEPDKIDGMPNPNKEITSLEDLSDAINMALYRYEGASVSEETYNLIDGEYPIAEYRFKLSEKEVNVRASKAPCSIDISGVYVEGDTLFAQYLEEETSGYIENDSYIAHRWFTLDGQYVVSCKACDFTFTDFTEIVEPMEIIKPKTWNCDVAYEDYRALCGYYVSDNYDIAAIIMEKDHVRVIVATSVTEGTHTYEMPAVLKGNELVFESGVSTLTTYDSEAGESTQEPLNPVGPGTVTVSENGISFENSGIIEIQDFVMQALEY